MPNPRATKAKRWVKAWLLLWAGSVRRLLFNAQTLITVISVPLYLWIVGRLLGPTEQWTEIVIQFASIGSVVVAIAVVIILIGAYAAFRVGPEERKRGRWVAGRFVYHEPQLAYSDLISPEDGEKSHLFSWKDAEPGSQIHFKIETEGRRDMTDVHVATSQAQLIGSNFLGKFTSGSLPLNRKREIWMKTLVEPKRDPHSVRVYITGFELPK